MTVAGEAYQFFEQRMSVAGLDRALKVQALVETTVMVLDGGIERHRATDLVEQFALRCDCAGVDVRAEIAKGLDAAEIKQSSNGRGLHGEPIGEDAGSERDELLPEQRRALDKFRAAIANAGDQAPLVFSNEAHKLLKAVHWRSMTPVEQQSITDAVFKFVDAHEYCGLKDEDGVRRVWLAALHAQFEELPHAPSRLILLDPTSWEDKPVPVRKWLVRDRIPPGKVCLLNGDGAAGKTTITLQLCAATPRGADWLGAVLEQAGPALFISAEEDADEIHRRLAAIVDYHKITFADLKGLGLRCIPGEDAVLGRPDKSGIIQPTPLFGRLEEAACDLHAALVAIEAAADVFAGNENDRSQVRQFIGLMTRLARASGAAVLLVQHPSLTGLNSGTGTSGSTAWNNSVRARMNFASVKPTNGDGVDPDLRQLQVLKSPSLDPKVLCPSSRSTAGAVVRPAPDDLYVPLPTRRRAENPTTLGQEAKWRGGWIRFAASGSGVFGRGRRGRTSQAFWRPGGALTIDSELDTTT
jgi:AAA domain